MSELNVVINGSGEPNHPPGFYDTFVDNAKDIKWDIGATAGAYTTEVLKYFASASEVGEAAKEASEVAEKFGTRFLVVPFFVADMISSGAEAAEKGKSPIAYALGALTGDVVGLLAGNALGKR